MAAPEKEIPVGSQPVERWRDHALCRGFPQKWWFPEQGGRFETAVFICSVCPSQEPCRQYAIDEKIIHGVWGGLTEAGRRRRTRKMAGRGRPVEGKQPRPADGHQVLSDGIRTEEAHTRCP